MVGYHGAHSRCSAMWGKASEHPCATCGATARHWAYDGTDPAEMTSDKNGRTYSAWPEFYRPLCLSCHRSSDWRRLRETRTHCRSGKHEWVASNIYVNHRKDAWSCRPCQTERRRELRRKHGQPASGA